MLLECVDMTLIKLLIVNDFHIWLLQIWNIGRTTSRARVSQHDAQISLIGHHKMNNLEDENLSPLVMFLFKEKVNDV